MAEEIQWPSEAVNGDDLATPAARLLRRLNLLAEETPGEAGFKTPYSLQVLKSGALSVTKVWTSLAAIGGAAAFSTAWAAFLGQDNPVKIAVIASAAFLLTGLALTISVIVKADVDGRASATSARVTARALVTTEFLRTAASLQKTAVSAPNTSHPVLTDSSLEILLMLSAYPGTLRVAREGDDHKSVTHVRRDNGAVQIRLEDGEWVPLTRLVTYTTEP